MKKATRQQLANVAKAMAQIPFHGFEEGKVSNLEPIVQPFPNWTLEEADRLWCAAFVYYCCREAGFEIPIRPNECKTCHLAGCIAWEEFATGDPRIADTVVFRVAKDFKEENVPHSADCRFGGSGSRGVRDLARMVKKIKS